MYEIKVLSGHDFDSLPSTITRGSDISDSLGFADRRTGRAYVRYSAHPELQKYLINHELDELEANESTHEDGNGIRHKKFFKQLFAPFIAPVLASLIPGIGPIAGPLTAGVGQAINKSTEPGKQSFGELLGAGFGGATGGRFGGLGGLFGGGKPTPQEQPLQETQQFSQFKPEQTGSPLSIPQSQGGTLGQFSVATQGTGRAPETGGFAGGLNPQGLFGGTQQRGLSPDLLERVKGFVSGRIPF